MAKNNAVANLGAMELTMSAGEALEFIKTFIDDSRESIMLWGGPGIGKSSIVQQLAKQRNAKLVDLRLATLDSTVIGGIPARDPNDPTKMTMLRPDFWPDEEGWIVNLDEFSNCPPAIQNVALQVLLDKRIHTHQMPLSTIVIATGNRGAIDGSYTNRLSLPSANRMKHITIEPRWQDVRTFFKSQTDISQYIVSFLDANPDFLYQIPKDMNQMCFPTPRSWHHFGNSLFALQQSGNLSMSQVSKLAICTLGKAVALQFESFMALANKVSAEDIIEKGKIPQLDPRDPSLMYAACGAVVTYFLTKVGTTTNKIKQDHVKHMFDFLEMLPTEFMTATFKDMNWLKNKQHYEACKKHEYARFQKLAVNLKDILGA